MSMSDVALLFMILGGTILGICGLTIIFLAVGYFVGYFLHKITERLDKFWP